jgi:hypothetical protein
VRGTGSVKGVGGYSALALIELLGGYSPEEAVAWARLWLDHPDHAGTGDCTGSPGDDPATPASKEEAQRAMREAIAIEGTPGETYLREIRRIEPPFPKGIKFWPNARTGEGGILFELTWNGRPAGCQVGYLDPEGNKSTVLPCRRKLMLEKAPGAHFVIPASTPDAETIIACGLEDALAIRRYMRRTTPVRIIGLPGDSALRHIRINKGDVVTVCRDADGANEAADRAIADGLDSLLLQAGHAPDWSISPNQVGIFVTNTQRHGKDANAVLLDKGVDGLDALLADIERAKLSVPRGVIGWLAGLDRIDLDPELRRAAKATGRLTSTLKAEIADLKRRTGEHRPDEPDVDPSLPDEDINIGAVLDALLIELRRYIVAPDTTLAAAAAWAAFTHLVHSDRLAVPVAPRLGVQAKTAGCGKTLLLEVLNCVVFNPRAAASITASTVLRTFGITKPTMLVDEAQHLLRAHDKSELISLLNAGHYRWNSFVERSVQTPSGQWQVEQFSVWGTMALASIGELPEEQQQRAIIVNLRKVLAKDVPARLRHGNSAELQRLRKELVSWALTLEELPSVDTPRVLQYQPGRVFDNWEPLLQIAALAGGKWPELINNALADAVTSEKAPAPVERVLSGIKRAFESVSERTGENLDRLTTAQLLAEMIADRDEEWGTEYRGRPITPYWLRGALRGLLDPSGTMDWWEPENVPRAQQRHQSGYFRSQFTRAWEVYLADDASPRGDGYAADAEHMRASPYPSGTSGSSGTSGTAGGNAGVSDDNLRSRSNGANLIGIIADSPKHEETRGPVPDAPDVPDVPDQAEEEGAQAKNGEDRPRRQRGALAQSVRDFSAANPTLTQAQLAKKFGVSQPRISQILKAQG